MDFAELSALAGGHAEARAIQVALKLGIFEALAHEELDEQRLASAIGCAAQPTGLLANALAAMELLEKQSERYRLTGAARRFLVESSDQYLGGMILFDEKLFETWGRLEETIRRYQKPHPERFLVFVEPWWSRVNEPGYSQFQADELVRARRAGAYGLKVLKTLGLYLREGITTGPLLKVDDRRFDLMWEACGSLKMPVAIHVSDPEAFFLPIDRFNERFEELNNHPDWSFHGRDFPSNAELLEARNRMFARHPRTQFIVLHVGNNAEACRSQVGKLRAFEIQL